MEENFKRKEIYAVFYGVYSDWHVVGYFDNKEDAKDFCKKYSLLEDYYIISLSQMKSDNIPTRIGKQYVVSCYKTKNGVWDKVICAYPDSDCYRNEDIPLPSPKKFLYERDAIHLMLAIERTPDFYDGERTEEEILEEKAKKIFQDDFAKLLSLGDGEVTEEAVAAMNAKFANYQE